MKNKTLIISALAIFSLLLGGCVTADSEVKVMSPKEKAERIAEIQERFGQVQLEASLKDDVFDVLLALYIAAETKRIADPTRVELYKGSMFQPCKAIYISSESRLSETELAVTGIYAQKWNWPLCRNLKLKANLKTNTAKPQKVWLFTNAETTKRWYFNINNREILIPPQKLVKHENAKKILDAIANETIIDSVEKPHKSHNVLLRELNNRYDEIVAFVRPIDAILGAKDGLDRYWLLFPHIQAIIDIAELEVHLRRIEYRDH